jgi:hypothetical protein
MIQGAEAIFEAQMNFPREKSSQEAGMDQSNQSWRGKGKNGS